MSQLPQGGRRALTGIAFHTDPPEDFDQAERLRLVYRLDENIYGGRSSAQLIVEQLEMLPS